jgi:2,3-bisphosphoglycerate-independent phosphoglycerate mutase
MKYAIVIPDGCADEPQEALGGKTPLQAAHKPHMDGLARAGVVGRADNVPKPLTPASDVATLSLFGYDPLAVYTGRAPLEAAAMGVALGPDDWAVRCNLVTVEDGRMRDFTAGHISSEEARELISAVQEALGRQRRSASSIETFWYAERCLKATASRLTLPPAPSRRTTSPTGPSPTTCRRARAPTFCGNS